MPQHNTAIPAVSARGYEAARRGAAFFERPDRGRLVVSGRDRASYLHGLLTNDVALLGPGDGRYAAYLTPQGRMIADLFVYELGDLILLVVPVRVKDALLATLDRFIFGEDVQLGDVTGAFAEFAVVGPAAAQVVARVMPDLDMATLGSLPDHGNRRTRFDGTPAIVTRITDTGEPGFGLFVASEQATALRRALEIAGPQGAIAIDAATAETLRIEAGVPLFGRDMDETTIPLEAGIESRAISFTKGCYVGQEVIIRVMHRGHGRVAKKLAGLIVESDRAPAAGATIRSGDREVGRVTSSAWSPSLDKPIALGYLQRDFLSVGAELTIAGARAVVSDLPFVSPAS